MSKTQTNTVISLLEKYFKPTISVFDKKDNNYVTVSIKLNYPTYINYYTSMFIKIMYYF